MISMIIQLNYPHYLIGRRLDDDKLSLLIASDDIRLVLTAWQQFDHLLSSR